MRKSLKRIILFLVMAVLVTWVLTRVNGESGVTQGESGPSGVSVAVPSSAPAAPIPTAEVIWIYPEGYVDLSDLPEVDITSWEFTLVNALDPANYLREGFVPNLVNVEGFQVRTGVDGPLEAMLADVREAGYTVSISRAYMSYYEISYKFNGVASGLADGQNMDYADAVEKARTITHYPGTDEHQLGVAVNFVDGEGNWEASSPAMQYLAEHCAEYGFILRYPMGRYEYTGWEYTPNQFRYVGKDAAAYIMEKGISLEEFLLAYKGKQ